MPRPIFILSVKLITNLNPWLRSAPLANFDLSKVQKNISNFKPNDIGPYLAGLFEGDGHVSLSKIINYLLYFYHTYIKYFKITLKII